MKVRILLTDDNGSSLLLKCSDKQATKLVWAAVGTDDVSAYQVAPKPTRFKKKYLRALRDGGTMLDVLATR